MNEWVSEWVSVYVWECVCVCVCACLRVCVRVYVCVCVCFKYWWCVHIVYLGIYTVVSFTLFISLTPDVKQIFQWNWIKCTVLYCIVLLSLGFSITYSSMTATASEQNYTQKHQKTTDSWLCNGIMALTCSPMVQGEDWLSRLEPSALWDAASTQNTQFTPHRQHFHSI